MARSFLWKNWRKGAPRYDYESMCSICGVACARSLLRKKADGLFYCPDCQPGRDAVTLSRLNADGNRNTNRDRHYYDGGGFDSRDYGVSATQGVWDSTFDGSFN